MLGNMPGCEVTNNNRSVDKVVNTSEYNFLEINGIGSSTPSFRFLLL